MATTWRYTGGGAVEMQLPSGRTVTLDPGDLVEALPNERDIFAVRSDFESVKPAELAEEGTE